MREGRLFLHGLFKALGAVVFLVLATGVQAQDLKWDETVLAKTASAGDKTVEFVYPFINTGKESVTVSDIRTSCGCTTAELAKKVIAPGEKGELKAVFTVGDKKGHEEKTILVQTTEKDNVPYILTLKVDMAETGK